MRILFFDIDCLRPDHLGCYGYNRPTSPNIDAVAGRGAVLENCYCASSPCMPSRTGWISGRFGIRNGVCSNLGKGAEFFIKNRGYMGPEPCNEYFTRQMRKAGMDTISVSNFADRHNAWYFMAGWTEYLTPNLKGGTETAAEVSEVALRWLNKNKDRDNFFMHVNFWDTHRTYRMDTGWADRFRDFPADVPFPDGETIARHQRIKGPFTATGQFGKGETPPALMPGQIENRADFEKMVTAYDASIAYVDHHIGLFIDYLKENGLYEDTAIIVSSDHGDAFGEHGIYTDHVCADECIHHIPFVVKWPGVARAGHRSDALLYNIDVAPTVCDILATDIPADWDGTSFRAHLEGKPDASGRDYLVWDHALYAVQRAVRTRDYLLIRTYDDFGFGMKPVELYRISQDPYQTRDLAAEHPEIVREMDGLLQEWLYEQTMKGDVIPDPLMRTLMERSGK